VRFDRRYEVRALPAVLAISIVVMFSIAVPGAGADDPAVTKTVLLVGDSVPHSYAEAFSTVAAEHGYVVTRATQGGCPATGVGKVYSSGERFKSDTCPRVVEAQDAMIEAFRPALVIWWSRYEVAPRLGPGGKILPLGSKAYWRAQQSSFRTRVHALTRLGARLVAVQIERPGRALAVRNPPEKAFLVGQTLLRREDIVNAWNSFLARHEGPKVFSVSIDGLVCRNAKRACDDRLPTGESARPDGVHYSPAARALLAPAIFDAAWRAAALEPAPTP
jgi:hypothetical protein